MMLGIVAGQDSARGFITRWTVAGDAAARTITLPLSNAVSESYNCTVDWGDGSALSTVTAYDDADRAHTYASNGTYDVEIRGTCEGWSFSNGGDKLKIVAVVNWGNSGIFGGFLYLYGGFWGCTNLASLAAGSILVSGAGPTDLYACFFNAPISAIPAGLLDNLTAVTTLLYCFYNNALTAIPAGLLDHCTEVTSVGYCFSHNSITSIPAGLLDHCTKVTSVAGCFDANALTAIPAGLLDHCTEVTDLTYCFDVNAPLQLGAEDIVPTGGEATRFLNKLVNFASLYARASFSGAQGTSGALWDCDFGEKITLDVAPAVDWEGGDVITGQTSAAVATVVAKVSALVYKIKKHFGTFTLGEVVGVTGTADKLADQGAANPAFAGKPVSAGCFGGAGNSLASITNYADIPADWK